VNGSSLIVLAILNGTAFYVLGICLASLALIVTAVGLRDSNAFSSNLAARLGALIFLVLVIATTTFAVRYSQNEQSDRRAKLAAEEKQLGTQQGGQSQSGGGAPETTGTPGTATLVKPKQGAGEKSAAKEPGGTVKLSADPTQIAYTTKSLSSKPGQVTIDFTNPSQLQHDVAIAQGSKQIAVSKLITQSSTSVSADLASGKYVFYCTVPGHREAGMQGTLNVK
jgi:plastocyanin